MLSYKYYLNIGQDVTVMVKTVIGYFTINSFKN